MLENRQFQIGVFQHFITGVDTQAKLYEALKALETD